MGALSLVPVDDVPVADMKYIAKIIVLLMIDNNITKDFKCNNAKITD